MKLFFELNILFFLKRIRKLTTKSYFYRSAFLKQQETFYETILVEIDLPFVNYFTL